MDMTLAPQILGFCSSSFYAIVCHLKVIRHPHMALVFPGASRCPICSEVIQVGQEIFATSGGVISKEDPLWRFQDAAMHQLCFLSWDLREKFIKKYNEFHARHSRGMRFMRADGTIEERDPLH